MCHDLRNEGFEALTDIVGRGLKAQMRYANKIGATFTLVLGDSELESGKAKLKCMATSEEKEIELDSIISEIYNARLDMLAEAIK
jgi:histidyl-tRNA synthetase